jgi:hypothetical protein
MSKIGWVFEPTPEMGGATGEAYTSPLVGAGMSPAALLAREAIQNSTDACEQGAKVRVDFRRVQLKGKAKAQFIRAMGLQPAVSSRRKSLKLAQDTCLDHLDDDGKPLQLLFVEDFGTYGLFGSPSKPRSHFFRLLLSLGDGAKSNEAAGSGGSYGFGKSVYSSNSRIKTIVAYSVFDPALSGVPEQNHARLMGCGYFKAHEHKGRDYSGRAWFGLPRGKGDSVGPLVDAAAHDFAEQLGFKHRTKKERGTSLLILDCNVDCEMLRTSIEESWWPRLLDDNIGLDITLSEQGQVVPPPRPRKRTDLAPFIECLDLALGRSAPVGLHQKAGSLNKLKDIPLGDFGYAVVPEDVQEDEGLAKKLGTIALIRLPRMVIEYMPAGGALPLPCVGAFVAAPEVDDFLKRSEPSEHNRWDPQSTRLEELKPEAREAVDAVLRRVKNGIRKFANEASPQAPAQDLRIRSLEKLLGGLFRPPTTRPGGTGATTGAPIKISFVDPPHTVADMQQIVMKGRFKVSLSDEADRPRVKLLVRVTCLVQEDDGLSREDPIPVELKSDDLNGSGTADEAGNITFDLDQGTAPVFQFSSLPYSKDWTTQIQVEAEEV